MLTMEGLIAVISLCLTAFGLGYAIGSKDKNKPQIAAHSLENLAAILYGIVNSAESFAEIILYRIPRKSRMF